MNLPIYVHVHVYINRSKKSCIISLVANTVADPGFGGRGGVNCHRQGRSPCSRHEVPSGGRVREGGVPPPHREENGNQEMLRGLLKHTKIRIL